jgi:pyrroline-5-carboxylate reductase
MKTLAFIGAGRMARAMVGGILRKGLTAPGMIRCIGADDGTAEALAASTGIVHRPRMTDLLAGADVVILACKPQQLAGLDQSAGAGVRGAMLISILAGVPISRLAATFPHAGAIVRAMPNTPGLIGAGMTVYATQTAPDHASRILVEEILGALGRVHAAPESALDAVTGLSGSGPGYVFEFIAALRDAGIAAGLSADLAAELALHTVLGSARLLEAIPQPPETHRDWVCSPGGTTLAGLAVLNRHDFRGILRATVQAATERARELAEE